MIAGPQIDELTRAYKMLDVPSSASPEDIKKAYRRITKRWHPDRYRSGTPAHSEATQMMKQINEAYSQIADAPLQHTQGPRNRHEPTHPPRNGPPYPSRRQPVSEKHEPPTYNPPYSKPLQTDSRYRGSFRFWLTFALGCAYGAIAAAFCLSLFPTHPLIAIIRSVALVLGGGYIYARWEGWNHRWFD